MQHWKLENPDAVPTCFLSRAYIGSVGVHSSEPNHFAGCSLYLGGGKTCFPHDHCAPVLYHHTQDTLIFNPWWHWWHVYHWQGLCLKSIWHEDTLLVPFPPGVFHHQLQQLLQSHGMLQLATVKYVVLSCICVCCVRCQFIGWLGLVPSPATPRWMFIFWCEP